VCHFLAGWIAGIGRNLLECDVLCEETACAAQGYDRCEFELRPLGRPM
jgi:predicted hydrocarbon binding protein